MYYAKDVGYVEVAIDYDSLCQSLEKTVVKFGASSLIPECNTTLENYFNVKPIKFVGSRITTNSRWLFFYLGAHSGKHYFLKFLLLDWNKLFILHSGNGGREYNYIKGIWDWNRQDQRFNTR